GVAARSQPVPCLRQLALVEARSVPAEALRPADRELELVPALVELGAVDLEDRRLRPRLSAGFHHIRVALHGEREAPLVHGDLDDAIAQQRSGDAPVAVADVLARQIGQRMFGGDLVARAGARAE